MIKNSRKSKTVILKHEPAEPAVAPVKLAAIGRAETPKPAKPSHISVELVKPDAKAVYVAGSFNQWKPDQMPLIQKGNGRWVGDVSVPPGRYEYLFVVDGQWVPDPNARETVKNPFGGHNSVLTVSE